MRTSIKAWLVPVAAAAVVAGAVLWPGRAGAEPPLPPITAQDLAANVAGAPAIAFSGTVSVTTDIGLPDLSPLTNLLGMQAANWTSLLAGTTTVKVWVDPAAGARAEIDGATSAYVAVANATSKDAWIYSSATNQATHLVAPAGDGSSRPPADAVPTPQTVANDALDALSPSTEFAVSTNTIVAGRPAYTLTLTPRTAGSLIASVDLAVDASTWLPLAADVYSTQLPDNPALRIAFTSISYATPRASLFSFTAPDGATVTTMGSGSSGAAPSGQADRPGAGQPSAKVVAGEAWTAVVELSGLPADQTGALTDPAGPLDSYGHGGRHGNNSTSTVAGLVGQLAQQVPEGTAYSTYLFSALVTPDGRVFAGAVPISDLQAAARANA
ncbi:MAG: hypothetical protein FWC46_06430 [Actinomycetia bacterium]|nr:hypothetical protein [Actinomycetes bacterium]